MTDVQPTVKGVLADIGERAVKTFAQTLIAYFGAGSLDLLHTDWKTALSLAGGAGVLSVLSSLVSLPIGQGGTASLTSAVVPATALDYGRHAAPVAQQEPDEQWVAEIKGPRPLGRIVRHDPRSLRYLVPETDTVQSVMWERKTPILDQGNLGSCTGNATVGVLGTTPFYDTVKAIPLDEAEAVKVYSLATQLDNVSGTYPPDDTGSSGLGAAQAAKRLGLISGYQHITSVAAAHTAIQAGPFIVGTDWLTGMDNPDQYGVVHAAGSVRGGHEYECIGYDAATDRWAFCNSWGPGWGLNGRFYYSSADFAKLLARQGDATTFVPITQPAPVPTPTPVPTPDPTPTPTPAIPADWVAWAEHVLTLQHRPHLPTQVAQEIIAAAGK